MRRVVVTGIGIVAPCGATAEEAWARIRDGRPGATPIDRFDASPYAAGQAGVVDDAVLDRIPTRRLKRMDRFCQLAMVAAEAALCDSRLATVDGRGEDVGVYVGNMFAGWGITDPSLRSMLRSGYEAVSPYVASAWFPTAVQGQVTINWNLRGYSKTVVADTASSALAIGYAYRAIQDGRASAMVCGGAEAPVTPYTYTFCSHTARLDPEAYRPFDVRSDGYQVGEGAAMLVIEDLETARARGARIHAEIAGFSTGKAPRSAALTAAGAAHLGSVVREALGEAQVAFPRLDYVALDARGGAEADAAEEEALAQALGDDVSSPRCSSVKAATTHLLGAATAAEAVGAVLAMAHGEVPPIAGCGRPRPSRLRLVTAGSHPGPVRTALVNARGEDGTCAALVLTRPEPTEHQGGSS